MREWRRLDVILNKVIIIVPTFGVISTLKGSNENGIHSVAIKDQINKSITNSERILPYYQICDLISNKEWTLERDSFESLFAYTDKQRISFDDKMAAIRKSEYVKTFPLSGIMIDVSNDDFWGRCGEKYPILSAINGVLYPEIPIEDSNVLLIVISIIIVLIILISIFAIVLTIRARNKNRTNINETEDRGQPAIAETDLRNEHTNAYSLSYSGAYADVELTNDNNYLSSEKQDFGFIDETDSYVEMRVNLN